MQIDVLRSVPRILTVSESSRRDVVEQMGVRSERLHVVPIGVDATVFRPRPEIPRVPGRITTTASADVPMKGLAPLLEAVAKVRVDVPEAHLVVVGTPKAQSTIPALIEQLGLRGAVTFVGGITTPDLVELYAQSEIACVPSLYEGFSLPAVEAMACGVPVLATTGGAVPEVVGTDGDTGLLVPPGDPEALAVGLRRLFADPALRDRLGRRGLERGDESLHVARDGTGHGGPLPGPARRAADPHMLTVAFDRLDLGAGSRVLDLGCGGGRHTFEAWRRGATVVALDGSRRELRDVQHLVGAMAEAGEVPHPPPGGVANADALALPFPAGAFDFVIAAEVLEHVGRDRAALAELVRVTRPGGQIVVTVPAPWPERVCWALDRRYHEQPGGHVRIYDRRGLETKLVAAGVEPTGSHRAHALHAPYWWLRCATGVDRAEPVAAAKRYHDFLVWQLTTRPRVVDAVERWLDPVLGKSLVVYARKPT